MVWLYIICVWADCWCLLVTGVCCLCLAGCCGTLVSCWFGLWVGTLVGWLCVRGFDLLCGWWFDLLLVYLLLISFALRLFAVSWLFCRLICLWLALAYC